MAERARSQMPKPRPASRPPFQTLLLVEPDVLARAVLTEYLRGCGYVVHEAGTAQEALEALRVCLDIDLVLTEIQGIGTLSGFELAHAIRLGFPGVDVILTASEAGAAEKCHDLCEHRIVRKPFTPLDLLRQIRLLRQKRRRPRAPES